jgi:hypothetical protein
MKQSRVSQFVQSPEWLWWFLFSLVICAAGYCLNLLLAEVNPGNAWGLTYGTLATVVMAGVALYGVRRRRLKSNLGASRTWVQFHLYAGVLFLVLVFMHIGFRLPSGALNWLMWTLSIWVTVSGLIGVAIQKVIPRMLASGLSVEAVFERIPDLVAQIRERAEKLAGTCADPIKDLYRRSIAPALAAPQPRVLYYVDITGGIQSRMQQFEYLRQFLDAGDRENLEQLRALFKTKLELDAHYTLQKALRWWLYTHLPPSIVLLVAVVIHLWVVVYY